MQNVTNFQLNVTDILPKLDLTLSYCDPISCILFCCDPIVTQCFIKFI